MPNQNVSTAANLLKSDPHKFFPLKVNEGTDVLARLHEHIPSLTLEELDAAVTKNLIEHPGRNKVTEGG